MKTKTAQKKSAFAASPVNSSKESTHPFTPAAMRAPAIPAKLTGEEQLTSFATRLPPRLYQEVQNDLHRAQRDHAGSRLRRPTRVDRTGWVTGMCGARLSILFSVY